jgi:hypothetical protein
LEKFEQLFREAERIRPPAGLWETIAARSGLTAKLGAPENGWGWKAAASMAVGMGILAAMLVVLKPAPKVADRSGGAEDFAVARSEASPLPDMDDLYWHADLGEESGMDWVEDVLLFDHVTVNE